MTVTYHVGDTRDIIATIPDGSVDLIASSPPFLALRSYLPAGHEAKGDEIGAERNPAEFIDMLLGLTAEWGRVLAPHGSIAIELGDTFADSGANALPKRGEGNAAIVGDTGVGRSRPCGNGWPRAKSLALIPQLYAIALAYGINPLTGAPSPAGRWLVRNVITWHRPNPAVGALGDKYRPSTSQIIVATRTKDRWFDLTAVRRGEANVLDTKSRGTNGVKLIDQPMSLGGGKYAKRIPSAPGGAPPLDAWFDEYDGTHDTWTLTTQPSKLAHYAMWPAKLAERLILSMCPAEVCTACATPRRRMERDNPAYEGRAGGPTHNNGQQGSSLKGFTHKAYAPPRSLPDGWTDCGCGAPFTAGTVLDPFCGTFTTGLVAEYHGRDAIGIDLDSRNRDLMPLRREEIRRNLNPTHVRAIANQLDLFGAAS